MQQQQHFLIGISLQRAVSQAIFSVLLFPFLASSIEEATEWKIEYAQFRATFLPLFFFAAIKIRQQ